MRHATSLLALACALTASAALAQTEPEALRAEALN